MSLMTCTRRLVLALLLAALPADAFAQSHASSIQESTGDMLDGRYIGILPCASCPGIRNELTVNQAGYFTLKEVYLDRERSTFRSKGRYTMSQNGTRLTLNDEDKRAYAVRDRLLCQVNADGDPAGEAYCLTRQDEFNGDGQQLFVAPESIKTSTVEGRKVVRFEALMNFEHRMQGGHKSITATMEIDCAKREVDMPVIAYFEKHDAEGACLESTSTNGGNPLPIQDVQDDVIAQAAQRYCR